jgi:hypothetical protein
VCACYKSATCSAPPQINGKIEHFQEVLKTRMNLWLHTRRTSGGAPRRGSSRITTIGAITNAIGDVTRLMYAASGGKKSYARGQFVPD